MDAYELLGKEHLDACILDNIRNLAIAELEIDRNGNCAQRSDAHIGKDKLRTVARKDTDAVALMNPSGMKAVTASLHSQLQVLVREPPLVIDDGQRIRRTLINQIMDKHFIPLFLSDKN